jgi:hypothetical protein
MNKQTPQTTPAVSLFDLLTNSCDKATQTSPIRNEEKEMVSVSTQTDFFQIEQWSRPITRSTTGNLKNNMQKRQYEEPSSSSDDSDDDAEYTPSKRRKKSNITQKREGVETCIQVNKIPFLMDKLLALIPENEVENYDVYAIETLFLNCALDRHSFQNEEQIFEFVKNAVLKGDKFKISGWKNPIPKPSCMTCV